MASPGFDPWEDLSPGPVLDERDRWLVRLLGMPVVRRDRKARRWRSLLQNLNNLFAQGEATMAAIDDLTTKLQGLTDTGDRMESLLGTLSTEIANLPKNGSDPVLEAALAALGTKIDAKTAEWTAALAADTPPTATAQ